MTANNHSSTLSQLFFLNSEIRFELEQHVCVLKKKGKETWMIYIYLLSTQIRAGIFEKWNCTFHILPLGSWLKSWKHISMKIQIHFPSTWKKKSHYLSGVMNPAGRCRYEPSLSDGDKVYKWPSEFRKIISDFDWKPILLCEQSPHERERAVNPAWSLLKTAALHFHIYPQKKSSLHLLLYLLSSHHTHLFV